MKIPKGVREKFVQAKAEADAFIDKRAAELAKLSPGVPVGVIRNLITGHGCACLDAMKISDEIEKENAA
ncbi:MULTISPECIES: hypothetical protein [Bradyrhizobium]|uniref:hypothetical protein n=1 Tax=Bradyrhizobium TaxID=374 RepID=UPI0020A18D35|nr:hypothetical protein [Bradyrhizobium elkanii]MCP1969903.1 hypothetical protein [Bradyrhizobium elkanii]MCS4108589.1 hypothetical protein [Bradyrhizobium elkanii]